MITKVLGLRVGELRGNSFQRLYVGTIDRWCRPRFRFIQCSILCLCTNGQCVNCAVLSIVCRGCCPGQRSAHVSSTDSCLSTAHTHLKNSKYGSPICSHKRSHNQTVKCMIGFQSIHYICHPSDQTHVLDYSQSHRTPKHTSSTGVSLIR